MKQTMKMKPRSKGSAADKRAEESRDRFILSVRAYAEGMDQVADQLRAAYREIRHGDC